MIEFIHNAGGQADLVAIRGISGGGCRHQLALGQFSGNRLADGDRGICRAGDAHGAVHIRTAAQRVTDGAADTGRRAAKGLNFRRVIVGFIFEEKQPGLPYAVCLHLDFHRAGIDFLALIQLRQLSVRFQKR